MDAASLPVTPAHVRSRFDDFGRQLTQRGTVDSYDVTSDDGVRLTLHRVQDESVASIEMTGTTEVYILELDGTFRTHQTAYEPADKWEAIENFLDMAVLYMRKEYVEEIHERKGRVIARSIRLGDQVISTTTSLTDKIRRISGGGCHGDRGI